jgi:hypothetical protein
LEIPQRKISQIWCGSQISYRWRVMERRVTRVTWKWMNSATKWPGMSATCHDWWVCCMSQLVVSTCFSTSGFGSFGLRSMKFSWSSTGPEWHRSLFLLQHFRVQRSGVSGCKAWKYTEVMILQSN